MGEKERKARETERMAGKDRKNRNKKEDGKKQENEKQGLEIIKGEINRAKVG